MTERKWWQDGVFYQIYPRSFADGNGDGVGDFPGMAERLDYLQWLGIDAVWLSPHFPSPQFDCGYDITDYTDVAPEYGTLQDFQRFLDGAHARGIRVILDLVLNHTSHLHPWFVESASGRDNPKRDWYVWRDGQNGGPPNNWRSTFGGPAWELDPASGQYYYHFFLKEQPDLNWRNPQVRQAMWDAVRFWLEMGVDGFRLDAVDTIYEDPELPDHRGTMTQEEMYRAWRASGEEAVPDNSEDEWEIMFEHQFGQPGLHELMRELRQVVDEYPDRVLVAESDEVSYCGDGTDELHMVFNFPLMQTARLTPPWVRANQEVRLAALPPDAWPCNTLGNHDNSRVYNRYGDGLHDDALARVHLALMLTLRGTPFLYNGEEIGMRDYMLTDIEQFRDSVSLGYYRLEREVMGSAHEEALGYAARLTRDRNRTPMQWSAEPNAGFSPPGVDTWLPVNPDYQAGVNVAAQEGEPGSLLNFYRRILHMRRQNPALLDGDYQVICPDAEDYLAFLRHSAAGGQTCLVVLNFCDRPQILSLPGLDAFAGLVDPRGASLIFSSHARASDTDDLAALALAPFEVYIAQLR